MTKIKDKMPVLGKRYRWEHAPHRYHLVIGFFRDKIVAINDKYLCDSDEKSLDCAELMTFEGFSCLTNFEELPEDNKKGIVAIFPDFAEEPNQPTEALKAEMANEKKEVIAHYHSKKIEPKIDIKEECVGPVSIWKDVGELPDGTCQVILKLKYRARKPYYCNALFNPHVGVDGIFYTNGLIHSSKGYCSEYETISRPIPLNDIEEWCYNTDFINSFEQMQKDIAELKRNKLEGK